MAKRVIGGVRAGSSELYEVIEDEDRPYEVVIRSVEPPSEQIRISRGAIPNLINVLKTVDTKPVRSFEES